MNEKKYVFKLYYSSKIISQIIFFPRFEPWTEGETVNYASIRGLYL